MIVKLLAVGEPHADGMRTVFFELNGQPREVEVTDRSLASSVREVLMADPSDPNQVGSPLPGLTVGVLVSAGDAVRKGQKLISIESMKMETTIYAERAGRVAEVLAIVGHQVKTGELLLKLSPEGSSGIALYLERMQNRGNNANDRPRHHREEDSLRKTRHHVTAIDEPQVSPPLVPDVDIDTKKQTIRVRDARIINAGQRAFCRRLLEAAARRPGISKAEVDLADACCRIEFAGRTASSQKMADLFADCVQEAAR